MNVLNSNRRSWRMFSLPVLLLLVATLLTAAAAFAESPSASQSSLEAQSNIVPQDTATPTCSPSGSGVWSIVPSPEQGTLSAVAAIASDDVWAVGAYQADHWDGATWSLVPLPDPGGDVKFLQGVAAISSNDVWAVGYYQISSNNQYFTLTEHWNGSTWSIVPSPGQGPSANYLQSVAAVSSNDVWAVGYYYNEAVVTQTLIEHWDGAAWSIVSSPSPGTTENRLNGVAAVSTDDVWAVGYYRVGGGNSPELTLIEHWDGAAWSIVSSPSPGTIGNFLHGVTAVSANDVWAVGDSCCVPGPALIEHWNGSTWSILSGPSRDHLQGVAAVSSNDVWAVGWYSSGGNSLTHPESMHWDRSMWTQVTMPDRGGLYNNLYGVAAISASDVWAVGYNSNPDGTLIEHFTTSPCVTVTGTPSSNTPTRTATPSNTVVQSTSTAIATSIATATACTIEFTDVPSDNPFYTYIRCLACRGIISGYGDGSFKPGNDITRGQIAKMVSNAAGFEEDPGIQIYEDVDQTNPFYQWINRLSRRGHMGGYACGGEGEPCGVDNKPYFRPFSDATRGQLAKIVSNAAGFNDVPVGQIFADVPPEHIFYQWIQRLASRGIMGGYPCGGEGEPCDDQQRPYFRSFNDVTRGQTSKIVAGTFFPNCQTPSK